MRDQDKRALIRVEPLDEHREPVTLALGLRARQANRATATHAYNLYCTRDGVLTISAAASINGLWTGNTYVGRICVAPQLLREAMDTKIIRRGDAGSTEAREAVNATLTELQGHSCIITHITPTI